MAILNVGITSSYIFQYKFLYNNEYKLQKKEIFLYDIFYKTNERIGNGPMTYIS